VHTNEPDLGYGGPDSVAAPAYSIGVISETVHSLCCRERPAIPHRASKGPSSPRTFGL